MPTAKNKPKDISSSHASASDAVNYAILFLEAELSKKRFLVPPGESELFLQMRRDLPYFIHDTDLSNTQILLNRNYKPLGNNSRTGEGWVDYKLATNSHVQLTLQQIASTVSEGCTRGLFNDGNPPWRGRKEATVYLERLLKFRELL
jgi:hypothetical protein